MTTPRTAAATAAVRRRGQETKADALREAGWLAVPPEHVEATLVAVQFALDDPGFFELTAEQVTALKAVAGRLS